MISKAYGKKSFLAMAAMVLATVSTQGLAQNAKPDTSGASSASATSMKAQPSTAESRPYIASDTMQQVTEAAEVVRRMEADPEIKKLLQQAKGVFIVPTYGRGGWGIGIRGGEGVMLANNNGTWSSPVFYNIGGVSVGLQAGAEVGSIAMLLMNEKAVNEFMKENNFSVGIGTGLTLVNYTAKAQANAGRGDVIVWADTKGAFANATVGISDIHFDDNDNRAFYKSEVAAKDIISGKMKSNQAAALTKELSSGN
ncbi:lipid-binding SYLF domain-containing protein [Noviherbaspirillum sp.]|mgnify:CR=1 FL=1|uniref:lipid-binding SYLF domain-containing protein n=1 Tax=Noviherbaspirillum sp. TaxID=1926288 RepID=UPI002FE0D83F